MPPQTCILFHCYIEWKSIHVYGGTLYVTNWLNYWTTGLGRSFVFFIGGFIKIWIISATMSRLFLSSLSLPGVKEDMDVPYGPGYGVRWEGTSIRSVCVSFIKIWHQEPCWDFFCPPSLFLSLGGHGYSWWILRGGPIGQKCLWRFHQDLTCFACFREGFVISI